MKKIFLLLIISIFSLKLFAWEESSQIHDGATSSDGKWCAVTILDDKTKQESIWVYRTDAHWSNPVCLIKFKIQNGWSNPAVCYDKNSKSFIVYHHCYTPENKDGGIYEFPLKAETYSPAEFYHTDVNEYSVGFSRLLANDAGVYLIATFGKWSGIENRNTKLFKITREGNTHKLVVPESLKEMEFSHLGWWTGEQQKQNYLHRDIFSVTDSAIILKDKDDGYWWHFDCFSEELKQFESKETALKYDKNMKEIKNTKGYISKKYFSYVVIFAILSSILFILVVCFLIWKVKKEKSKPVSVDLLDTKEKNKFIFSIQEKERSKISRDIHDSVIQDIRVIRLETENLKVQEDSKNLQTKIEDIATDCIVKLRNICYNLSPAELMSHTDGNSSKIELVSIINSLAQQFIARTHVPCTVGVEDDFEYPPLEKEITQNLFRVVQEALTNIEKHSYATQTSIFIKKENNNIVVYITDDGIGCDQEIINSSLQSKDHLGLRSMKDRMDLIGGKIDFISSHDNGMEVRIELGIK